LNSYHRSAFQYEIKYKKGAKHGNADGISRNPLPTTAADDAAEREDELLEAYVIDMPQPALALTTSQFSELLDLYVQVDQALGISDAVTIPQINTIEIMQLDASTTTSTSIDLTPLANDQLLGSMTSLQWQHAQEADRHLAAMRLYLKSK